MLTDRLRAAVQSPITSDADDFDLAAELDAILTPLGLPPEETGGSITFKGRDPIAPSVLRLAAAPGLAMVAKSAAIASIWRIRTGRGQDISLNLGLAPRRLCPFYEGRWEKLNGFAPGMPNDPYNALLTDFYRTGDGRWVMPLNPYPTLKNKAQKLLRVYDDKECVTQAIAKWKGLDLEQAGAEAGIVMPMLRTTQEFIEEPQYRDVIASMPLIEIEKIGESDPIPFSPSAKSPLEGIRALGMGHAIAGAGVGRTLALHGADVLNIWRPTEIETDFLYHTAQVGVRSTMIDPKSSEGRQKIRQLLGQADIFYANRRPHYLESIGISAHDAAEIRPGMIHATVSLYGRTGPWASRIGFDQTAGCVAGTMLLEGNEDHPKLPVVGVVNDWIVAWLMTTGVLSALKRRATEGGSYRVQVCLTRVALWVISMGIFDKKFVQQVANTTGDHAYLEPELFTAETSMGLYQGVTDQVKMSDTPGAYRSIFMPRGTGRAEWLSLRD